MGCKGLTRDQLIKELVKRVIRWEKENWTPYPWRVNRTPYKVLIAELLLKRTSRQALVREFHKFIERFPNLNSIHSASTEEIEEALKHLGLYKQRAKLLKGLTEVIIRGYGGKIPDKWEDLVSLPGVGFTSRVQFSASDMERKLRYSTPTL